MIIKFSSSELVCKQLILTKSPKQLDIIFRQISLKFGIFLVILLILKVTCPARIFYIHILSPEYRKSIFEQLVEALQFPPLNDVFIYSIF